MLGHVDFVAARSPAAADLVKRWGAAGDVRLAPHAIPPWHPLPHRPRKFFTVGYAGRLVPEKGVWDLVEACTLLREPVRLHLVGDGPLRLRLEQVRRPNVEIRVERNITHDRMPEAYAEMDVLVLPSRTTSRWAEQFGRVLVEALSCDVPVVGSDSGEIPWVINATGGGHVFTEGNVAELARVLADLRDRPDERARLARRGRAEALRLFGVEAVADELDLMFSAAAGSRRERSATRPTIALIAHGVHDQGGMERACAELLRRGSEPYRFVVYSSELDPRLRELVSWKRIVVPPRPIPLKFLAFFFVGRVPLVAVLRRSLAHRSARSCRTVSTWQLCSSVMPDFGNGRAASRRPAGHSSGESIRPSPICSLLGQSAGATGRAACSFSLPSRTELPASFTLITQAWPTRLAPNGVDVERFRPDRGCTRGDASRRGCRPHGGRCTLPRRRLGSQGSRIRDRRTCPGVLGVGGAAAACGSSAAATSAVSAPSPSKKASAIA